MNSSQKDRANVGVHESLVISTGPAGTTLIGQPLVQAGALPAGTYTCKFGVDGLSRLDIRLKATFASGGCTTSGGATYLDASTVLESFVGVGVMSTGVEQALTLNDLKGERWAVLTLVVTGSVVTFTRAEVIGATSAAADTVSATVSGTIVTSRVKGTATRSSVATAASATLLAANANRKAAYFYNNHATITAYISPTSPAVAATDIPLPPGASYVDDDTTGAWYVIPASGTSDVRVVEVA